MKIQKFEITIAVPDDTEFVNLDKITSVIRDNADGFDAFDCAIEVKRIPRWRNELSIQVSRVGH